jgi:LysM repeat protein
LYEINKLAAAETERLEANTNLTDLQREIATKKVELAQLQAQAGTLGQTFESDTPSTLTTQPDQTADTPPPAAQQHTMRSGETLASLAAAYGVPINAILNANPGLQINSLRAGQQIVIPAAPRH